MDNQPYMVRPTLTDLIPDEPHYYSFLISLDRCDGSSITFEDLFGGIYVSN